MYVYFLYADGSGQTRIKNSRSNNGLYILSGVLVHEKDWRIVEQKLDDLKRILFPRLRSNKWELHAYHIWNNREFFARRELDLSITKKEEIFSRVVNVACESKITVINVIIFKDMLEQRRSSAVMKSSWQRLTARFEDFLRHKMLYSDDGLLFVDSSQKVPETEIKEAVLAEIRRKNSQLGSHRVIENPIFVESHRWNLIQLADMIAYITHRAYKKDPRFKRWFQLLQPKMYHSDDNIRGFGINEIPDLD